jgi:hypothetical protein
MSRIPSYRLARWKKLFGGEDEEVSPSRADAAKSAVGVQSDRPIRSASQDRLDRRSFATRIAHVLAEKNSTDSVVVGVYGPWGDGKSSLLEMIKEELQGRSDVVVVDYNPWFFSSDTESLTRSFFMTIGEALEQSGLFAKERFGSLLSKYGGLVPKFGKGIETIGKAMLGELRNIRAEVERVLEQRQKRVLVFVDDIDRLDRREIQTLFKLVRLAGDFPYTTYVLAFDDLVVAQALGEAYGSGDAEAGRRFIEKIVQVPLHLPPARYETLRTIVFENCVRVLNDNEVLLTNREGPRFGNAFSRAFEEVLTTPRQVKLYDNALTFAVPVLKGEVSIVDQMLVEALRVFVPPMYIFIRDNIDLLTRERDHSRQAQADFEARLSEAVAGQGFSAEGVREIVHLVQELFPRASGMGYGSGWEETWAKEKRICSQSYARRYFTYGVPSGDISDATIAETIRLAEVADAPSLEAIWRGMAAQDGFEKFIYKLRQVEETLAEPAIRPLVHVIGAHADEIPRTREIFVGDHKFRQAAILVAHLLKRAPSDRMKLLLDTISETPSFLFASEIVNWSEERDDDRGGRRGFLTKEEIEQVRPVLVKRFLGSVADRSPFDVYGEDLQRALLALVWVGGESAAQDYVSSLVSADASNAIKLVEAFTPIATEMATGIPHRSDFMVECYESLGRLVNPAMILEKLRSIYGAELDEPDYRFGDNRDGDERQRLAHQFAYVHAQCQSSREPVAASPVQPS